MAKSPTQKTKSLRTLIRTHDGNLSAIADALTAAGDPISRQGVTVRLRRHGLFELAATARVKAGLPGPRTALQNEAADPEKERADIEESLHGRSFTAAAAAMGVSRRTLYRRRKALDVAK